VDSWLTFTIADVRKLEKELAVTLSKQSTAARTAGAAAGAAVEDDDDPAARKWSEDRSMGLNSRDDEIVRLNDASNVIPIKTYHRGAGNRAALPTHLMETELAMQRLDFPSEPGTAFGGTSSAPLEGALTRNDADSIQSDAWSARRSAAPWTDFANWRSPHYTLLVWLLLVLAALKPDLSTPVYILSVGIIWRSRSWRLVASVGMAGFWLVLPSTLACLASAVVFFLCAALERDI